VEIPGRLARIDHRFSGYGNRTAADLLLHLLTRVQDQQDKEKGDALSSSHLRWGGPLTAESAPALALTGRSRHAVDSRR